MDQPNVVIVLCDTLRRDVLDVYGGPVSTGPLLEALGGKAVTYLGYSNSFWTIPSHFSFFTGLPVSKHGVHEAQGRNTIEAVMEIGRQYRGLMLAWELRRKGYETVGISNNLAVSHMSGLDRGFRLFVTYDIIYRPRPGLDLVEWLDLREIGKRYNMSALKALVGEARRKGLRQALSLARLYVKARLIWLFQSDYITAKGADVTISVLRFMQLAEPFFIFINLMEAHEPYYYADKFSYRYIKCSRCIQREFQGYLRSARACIRASAEIAKILQERGTLQRTLFVFTSDHGQEFAEHGALGHLSGHLYEEDIGIPIIVKPPDGLELAAGHCYVGLHELYGLTVAAASGERKWSPSCGPGIAESYEGVVGDRPNPEAGRGIRRVAVFKGDRKVAYRLDGGNPVMEEVAVAGRPLDPRSAEAKGAAKELGSYITALQ